MLKLKGQTDTLGNHHRYSIILLWLFEISILCSTLRGSHLEITIGIGPIDFTFGTAIWQYWTRA